MRQPLTWLFLTVLFKTRHRQHKQSILSGICAVGVYFTCILGCRIRLYSFKSRSSSWLREMAAEEQSPFFLAIAINSARFLSINWANSFLDTAEIPFKNYFTFLRGLFMLKQHYIMIIILEKS